MLIQQTCLLLTLSSHLSFGWRDRSVLAALWDWKNHPVLGLNSHGTELQKRQNPSNKKRNVPDKMNVNDIPVACVWPSRLHVKWLALWGDGGWLGEVSLPPSLCCLSLLCDVGHGTIHRHEQQALLLVEERRMDGVPRGKQWSRPNLSDVILRVAVVTVSAKGDNKTVGTTQFKGPFQWL